MLFGCFEPFAHPFSAWGVFVSEYVYPSLKPKLTSPAFLSVMYMIQSPPIQIYSSKKTSSGQV